MFIVFVSRIFNSKCFIHGLFSDTRGNCITLPLFQDIRLKTKVREHLRLTVINETDKRMREELELVVEKLETQQGKTNSASLTIQMQQRSERAYCQDPVTIGQWIDKEHGLHINVLALKAAKMAIMLFTRFKEFKSVHIKIDNITSLTYLVKMGKTKSSQMNKIIHEI